MRTINIPFPDISYFEKTRLVSIIPKAKQVNAGAEELKFRNAAGFSAGDLVILEAFEGNSTEIVSLESVDKASNTVILTDQTYQDHLCGTPAQPGVVIMKTPYDQVRVFKSSLPDIPGLAGAWTELTVDGSGNDAPTPLIPRNSYTIYIDPTGTDADYYAYQFVNSVQEQAHATTPAPDTLFTLNDYDSVLTTSNLQNWFMYGLDLTDDDGTPFPNSMFEFAIKAAVDSLEKVLNIRIKPTQVIGERQDYYRQDYLDFAFIQLNEYPIFDVSRVAIRYPTAGSDITFPVEWYNVNKAHGQVHLIPTSGSLSQILIGSGGDYLSFIYKGWDWMPNLWVIDYMAGFPPRNYNYISPQARSSQPLSFGVPNDIVAVLGRMACFYPLNIAGDLVGGIAIASKSIGIDGLSQSINTTSSPENAGYSARLRQYERELKIEIPRLMAYYKGLRLAVC